MTLFLCYFPIFFVLLRTSFVTRLKMKSFPCKEVYILFFFVHVYNIDIFINRFETIKVYVLKQPFNSTPAEKISEDGLHVLQTYKTYGEGMFQIVKYFIIEILPIMVYRPFNCVYYVEKCLHDEIYEETLVASVTTEISALGMEDYTGNESVAVAVAVTEAAQSVAQAEAAESVAQAAVAAESVAQAAVAAESVAQAAVAAESVAQAAEAAESVAQAAESVAQAVVAEVAAESEAVAAESVAETGAIVASESNSQAGMSFGSFGSFEFFQDDFDGDLIQAGQAGNFGHQPNFPSYFDLSNAEQPYFRQFLDNMVAPGPMLDQPQFLEHVVAPGPMLDQPKKMKRSMPDKQKEPKKQKPCQQPKLCHLFGISKHCGRVKSDCKGYLKGLKVRRPCEAVLPTGKMILRDYTATITQYFCETEKFAVLFSDFTNPHGNFSLDEVNQYREVYCKNKNIPFIVQTLPVPLP